MKLLVITAAFYDRDYETKIAKLNASAEKFDIDIVAFGRQETFYFYNAKIEKLGVVIDHYKNDFTHVLYTDCADSFFASPLSEIIEKYQRFSVPLLLSGEKAAYPVLPGYGKFPQSKTPYRYFNAGGFIGEIQYVLDTLSKLKAYYFVKDNDNAHWMHGYLSNRIELDIDYNCEIFQTFSDTKFDEEFEIEKGRVKNKLTGSYPCVLHFNGPKGFGTYATSTMEKVFNQIIK